MNRDMDKTVKMTCICCPIGCSLEVSTDSSGCVSVAGNKCPRGAAYGEKELTNPTRIVTSTVRIKGLKDKVVSVKTSSDIPKDKIFDCIAALAKIQVELPVKVGDVILKNVAETNADIVVTRTID